MASIQFPAPAGPPTGPPASSTAAFPAGTSSVDAVISTANYVSSVAGTSSHAVLSSAAEKSCPTVPRPAALGTEKSALVAPILSSTEAVLSAADKLVSAAEKSTPAGLSSAALGAAVGAGLEKNASTTEAGPSSCLGVTKKSFAQALKGSIRPSFIRSHAESVFSFGVLPDFPNESHSGSKEGHPAVYFSPQEVARAEALFDKAVVIKFFSGRPSLEECHVAISSQWAVQGKFSLGLLDSRTLLVRFQLESDMILALTRESKYLKAFPFKIYRWHKRYNSLEDASLAPVWVSLHNLPVHCFVPSFLKTIANQIGRFLRVDQPTATLTRPSVARLCIEVDLRKSLPNKIWIGMDEGFWQSIHYERLPLFCINCNIQGHNHLVCKKKQASVDSAPKLDGKRHQSGQPTDPSQANGAGLDPSLINKGISVEGVNASVVVHQGDLFDDPLLLDILSREAKNQTKTVDPPLTLEASPSTPSVRPSPNKHPSPVGNSGTGGLAKGFLNKGFPPSSESNQASTAKAKGKQVVNHQIISSQVANLNYWKEIQQKVSLLQQHTETGCPDMEHWSDSHHSEFSDMEQNTYVPATLDSFQAQSEEELDHEPLSTAGYNTDVKIKKSNRRNRRGERHPDIPLRVKLRERRKY